MSIVSEHLVPNNESLICGRRRGTTHEDGYHI